MALSYSAPPHELAIELSEVRADASALGEIISQLNAPLPKDFPRDAVLDLIGALLELPDGTARGCLRPLNETQAQLATIRSQHILHDDQQDDDEEAERLPLLRGGPLDQRLRGLMSSVSTALQTANRLAAEEPEPEEPEPAIEPPRDQTTAQLIERSSLAQKELLGEKSELESLRLNSEPASDLGRRLTDAVILNQLSRSELRLPRIVSARLRRLAGALRDYPALIQKAAELVSQSTKLADYAHEKWSTLETRIFRAGTSTIREIADDISDYAKKLDATRRAGDSGMRPPQDFDLDEATRLIHAGKPPPPHWRPLITHLPLKSRRLRSTAPLEGLSNLREINRLSVKVHDIEAFKTLTSLEGLDLSFTQVRNLEPIQHLKQLRLLRLMRTQISDLRPLAGLHRLEHLDIDGTNVVDLGPLKNLKALKWLDFRRTAVASLAPISELLKLENLYFHDCNVEDLSALSKLLQLSSINFSRTPVTDLSPLKRLTKLRSISFDETNVAAISSLSDLPKLAYLSLQKTRVSDLSPISGLAEISSLNANETKISDLSPLSRLPKLSYVSFANTAVSDLQPLAKHSALWSIDLDGTQVVDLSPLLTIPKIGSLHLANTKIQDFRILSRLTQLRSIWISAAQSHIIPDDIKARVTINYVQT